MRYKEVIENVSFFDIFLNITSTLVASAESLLAVILNSNTLASLLSFHLKNVVSTLDCFNVLNNCELAVEIM